MVPALVPAELASLTLVTMSCQRILQGVAAVLAILVTDAYADGPYNKPQLCVQTCYESISSLTFGDYDPTLDYTTQRCDSPLLVSSVYACYDLRCSSQFTVDESFGGLNAYCKEYGSGPLNGTYEQVIQRVLAQYGSMDNVPTLDPSTVPFTEVLNNTIVATTEYYDMAYKTLVSHNFLSSSLS